MIDSIIQFVLEAIFHGAFVSVLCLLILRVVRMPIKILESSRLLNAISYTLLLSSLIYIAWFAMWLFRAYFSGGEYEQYTITNRFIGPYWWAFWIFLFLPYWLLPQILWIRKFRLSIICLSIIAVIWEMSFTIRTGTRYYIHSCALGWLIYSGDEILDYLIHFLAYLPIVTIVYLVLSKKKTPKAAAEGV